LGAARIIEGFAIEVICDWALIVGISTGGEQKREQAREAAQHGEGELL
jgi:hypothetical protein